MENKIYLLSPGKVLAKSTGRTEVEMRKITRELLRCEMLTSQLRELAGKLKVDISDIPQNTRRKERIASRIWEAMGKK